MNIVLISRISHDRQRIYYSLEWGKNAGQRIATGIFTYASPINTAQKQFNKKAIKLVEEKRLKLLVDLFSDKACLPHSTRYEHNFMNYYHSYVIRNKIAGNRHLECSYRQFKLFIGASYLSCAEITEELSFNFRKYLLGHLNGETPANYFARYKQVLKAATKQGYFTLSPCQDIPVKANKNTKRKDNLEVEDYMKLLHTPITNEEVRDAFIFCCYTGLRWCDVNSLVWEDVKEGSVALNIIQGKTRIEHFITLHVIARAILDKRRKRVTDFNSSSMVFRLPTIDGSNKVLGAWCKVASIEKHITWSCARLSFSILLQDANVDAATVALLLGHTTTKYVNETYKRFRPRNLQQAIDKLPS